MSGRHSFSELTKAFTQERRRRIAEMKAEDSVICPGTTRTSSRLSRVSVAASPVSGACVSRLTTVLEYLASGMTEAEVLADFPYLTREDIEACRAFDADLKMQRQSEKS